MNCCDEYGDCRQGRNCPVRGPAKVAKVKSSKPRYASTPGRTQRNARLRILAKWMLIVWAMLISAPMVLSLASLTRGMA